MAKSMTGAATKTAAEAASWTKQLQEAFCESLKTGMANTVASGIVYGNWREQLKEAGINLVTDTAAHFGAAQIGGKRLEQIEADLKAGKTDIFNYVSHKVTHAALGAATRAAAAKLKGADSKQVRKAAKGGAVGAAAAEIVAEQMMPKAISSIESQLGEEGLRSGTRRYYERKQELLSTELIRIKAYGQIAAVLTAKAVGGDIHAAQEAAINAMTFNTTQVYEGLATHLSAATEDPFKEVFEQNSRPTLKKSKSYTELQQLYEMEIVESVDQAVRDDALNSDSIFKKLLYYASTAIGEVEGTTPMHAHRDRSQIRRAYKDAPKVYRESKALLQDLWHGRSIDDSRLDAYGQLSGDWAANCTGVMSGFVGGGKFGRGRASWMRTPHQQAAASGHLRPGIPLYKPANQNRAPAGTQRSANANRLYEDMRAVANGGNTHRRSAFSDLGARTAGTKFGMPERMSAKEWINKSTHAPRMSASSSGSSNAGRGGSGSASTGSSSGPRYGATSRSGNPRSDQRVNGHTSKLGRTLDGKEERKGKEREGGLRSSANSNPATTPNISENHDRLAHDGYYTRKNERSEQHNWQQRLKNAKPADYIKHTKARTAEEAKRMSETGERNAQYLPNFNRSELEQKGVRNGTLIKRDQSKGADYYIYKFDEVIGYNSGQATQWIRVELTKTGKPEYHGHPISEVTAKQYLKNLGN